MSDKRILTLLVILLAFQLFTWNNTKDLENQVRNLQNQVQNIQSSVSHEVSSVRNTVQQMRDDNRWWTYPNVEFELIDRVKTNVTMSWQVKEIAENDQVTFHYLLGSQKEYAQVVAEEISKGYYAVALEVDNKIEPRIEIRVNEISERGANTRRETPIEEKKVDFRNQTKMQYYYSLDNGSRVLTSDIIQLDLSNVHYDMFGFTNLQVNVYEKNLNAHLIIDNYWRGSGSNTYHIEQAYLENRSYTGVSLNRWDFDVPTELFKEHNSAPFLDNVPTEGLQQLYIVVKYTDEIFAEELLLER